MEREKNILDKLGSLIPGYAGYAERNGRRQCDRILRDLISSKIFACEKSITRNISDSIQKGNSASIEDKEKCRKRLNTISSKIKYAPYGESAFFSGSQIKEDELLEIYRKDLHIMETVTKLQRMIQDIDSIDLLSFIDGIESELENRNQYIREFK
jgi:hypothetical protein